MKKFFEILVIGIVLCVVGTGCNNLKELTVKKDLATGKIEEVKYKVEEMATTEKSVDAEESVWCLATSFYDFTTGNTSPYLKIGIFKIRYKSFPVKAGQGYAIVDEEFSSSWWNWSSAVKGSDNKTNLIRRTTVYIGEAEKKDKKLTVTIGDGQGIIIDKNGIKIAKDISIKTE